MKAILCLLALGALIALSEAVDCQEGYVECPRSGRCIHESSICDGKNDCGDWSDEPDTCPICRDPGFECANRKCVSFSDICDGWDDCGDNSDEVDSVTGECPKCPDSHDTCSNGRCILSTDYCNGVNNCGNWSDEEDPFCPCPDNEFRCDKQYTDSPPGECIPSEYLCDIIWDCPFGDDETNCTDTSNSFKRY